MPRGTVLGACLATVGLWAAGTVSLAVVVGCYALIVAQSQVRISRVISGFTGARVLRRMLRSAVFFLPVAFFGLPTGDAALWGTAAGVAYGGAFVLGRLPEIRFNLSSEFIAILPPLSYEDWIRETLHPLVGAVAQEYFYRGIVLSVFATYVGAWAVLLSTLLFALEHLIHFNAGEAFDRRDYLLHLALGLGFGVIFYLSGSLLGCILGHTVYNSPSALQALRRRPTIHREMMS